jgi:hypothetical protein
MTRRTIPTPIKSNTIPTTIPAIASNITIIEKLKSVLSIIETSSN